MFAFPTPLIPLVQLVLVLKCVDYFDEATTVFSDPNCIYEPDFCETEERQRALGMSDSLLLLLVVHTTRERDGTEIIRIISARKAEAHERRRYGNRRLY
jgi:uncharacterized DUF497 family protein